jgi:hypothetical protein
MAIPAEPAYPRSLTGPTPLAAQVDGAAGILLGLWELQLLLNIGAAGDARARQPPGDRQAQLWCGHIDSLAYPRPGLWCFVKTYSRSFFVTNSLHSGGVEACWERPGAAYKVLYGRVAARDGALFALSPCGANRSFRVMRAPLSDADGVLNVSCVRRGG